jgi:hypothetical protein
MSDLEKMNIESSKKEKKEEISAKLIEIKNLIQNFQPEKALEELEEIKATYDLKQYKGLLDSIEKKTRKCQKHLKAIAMIKDEFPSIYKEISLKKLVAKTGVKTSNLKKMVIHLIKEEIIQARLRGSKLVYIQEDKTIEILEALLEKQDNLEEYLRMHLATDFERIKGAWNDYKEDKIKLSGLIKEGLKILGIKFARLAVKSY